MTKLSTPQPNIIGFLASTELFGSLEQFVLEELAAQMEPMNLSQGQLLIKQGDSGDSLYLVKKGRLRVTTRNENGVEITLTTLGLGASVGEIALLTGERRNANVYADEDSEVLGLHKKNLDRVWQSSPDAMRRVSEVIVDRSQNAELDKVLFAAELFHDMSEQALHDLKKELALMMFVSGEILFHEGDASNCLFIIVSGRMQVLKDRQILFEPGRGQTVGEIGLLTKDKRTATVQAIRDTLTARLSLEGFNRLIDKHPQDMMRHFAGHIIKTLWNQTQGGTRTKRTVVNIAIIPTDENVPLTSFCRQLSEVLSSFGSTLHLSSILLDAFLSPQGIAQTPINDPNNVNIARWLNQQESKYRYILFETDQTPSEWAKRCLRQADKVLLVGSAESSGQCGQIETTLLTEQRYRNIPQTLVLLHQTHTSTYVRTGEWLAKRQVNTHYHIQLSDGNDFARLGRLLAGKGIGLVVSGGGARGFAHIGAVHALKKAGIPIDRVGGTSMGAIVGALVSQGWDYDTMVQKILDANFRVDYTFPVVSLAAGGSFTEAMKNQFGDIRIEDLWTNFFCVSTDLCHPRLIAHIAGPLWKYVRASASIPGLFPPVMDEENLLVDGAVVDNMPVSTMQKYKDIGSVIALDVSAPMRLKTSLDLNGKLSGWKVLAQRINPFKPSAELPTISKMLIQSTLVKSIEMAAIARQSADLYIQLPVQDFGLLAFDEIKKLATVGLTYTEEKIKELQDGDNNNLQEIFPDVPLGLVQK